MENYKDYILNYPDFPKPGVMFRDLSLLFTHRLWSVSLDLYRLFEHTPFDYIAGIDARGFIIGSSLASTSGKKFLPIRKKGKLPGVIISSQSHSEYDASTLEISPGSVDPYYSDRYNRVIIIDDVLATGGTFKTAHFLCEKAGYQVVGFGSIIDLQYLNQFEINGMKCRSLIQYTE
jgi:adenine phosphoribosyltransferase